MTVVLGKRKKEQQERRVRIAQQPISRAAAESANSVQQLRELVARLVDRVEELEAERRERGEL